MKTKEFIFEIKKPRVKMPKQRDPNWQTMQAKATSGAGGAHKNEKRAEKQGDVKHKKDLVPIEEAPLAADRLAARAGAAPGSSLKQTADVYQQKIIDKLGSRFGLPPGSTQDQVKAAQLAHLDKTDPEAAKRARQDFDNIDAKYADLPPASGQQKPVAAPTTSAAPAGQQKPAAPVSTQSVYKKPTDDPDFAGGLAAAKAGKGPIAIMLAQPTIANNPKLVDVIASSVGLPAGSSVEEILAAAEKLKKPAAQPKTEGYTTEKQILTRIRQIMYDRKVSGTKSNVDELNKLKQQLKDMRSQKDISEVSDFGEPREILEDVLRVLEREVEWPLTDVMDPREVKQLLAPVVRAVNDKMMSMEEARDDDWGSMSHRAFKRAELQHELGHETNNVSIDINGKPWKVLQGEAEFPSRALARAEKIAATIKRNAVAKGRKEPKVDVYVTGAPATE